MADSVLNYLDTYCERAGEAGMMGEPINFLSNLFFIMAALVAGRALLQSAPAADRHADLWFLVAFLFAIGVGSGMWHLIPTRPTLLMDVLPITLFINLFILSSLRRLFHLSWLLVAAWWGFYAVVTVAAQKMLPPDLLNGTIMYIPTYLALLAMTAMLDAYKHPARRAFLQALVVWTISLVFRTIDMHVCSDVSIGTHFLWHTLNAWVLWRLLMVVISSRRAPSTAV